jgi:2-oxo-hept-3-ene-1,7-dioate hydratase
LVGLTIAALAMGVVSSEANAQGGETCSLESWVPGIMSAWDRRDMIDNADCFRTIITSMDTGRRLRDEVVARFDERFPRAGYKVVGLDPVNAALPGVDRRMVGMMYVSMFLADGAILPLESAEMIIVEPDFIVSVADEGINDATTLEEVVAHLDRVYAFIETIAPTYVNNPPNPYLMQASNLMARWGVLGESVAVSPTAEFIRSLETMTVTFRDGDGNVLAEEPGSYLGGNPLNGVLVVIEELKRRGERLRPGDLISSGSYMPPIRVDEAVEYETIYEGIGGQTIRVSTSFR